MPRRKAPAADAPALPATVLPPATSDAVLDEVVNELNQLARSSGLDLTLAIGKLVIERFFDGDRRAWADRGRDDQSFRKLSEHPGLMMSSTALYRCCASYELVERLELPVSTWKQIGVSHLRAVLNLPEPDQRKLLSQAEEKGLTVDDLEQRVSKIRTTKGETRGRPRLPSFVKTVHQFEKLLDDESEAFDDLDQVETLGQDEALKLYQAVTGMKLRCEALQKALETKAHGSDGSESS